MEIYNFINFIKEGNKEKSIEEGLKILNHKFIPLVFYLLSEIYKFDQNYINTLENCILENVKFNLDDKIYTYFGIAQEYEMYKNYSISYKFYKLANDEKYKLVKNDVNIQREIINFDILKDLHIPLINNLCNKKIIFIVGLPRCGSTLLSKIINYNDIFVDKEENNCMHNIIELIKKNPLNCNETVYKYVNEEYNKQSIDKTLDNYQLISIIKNIFSNCKIIHLKRDMYNQLWSSYTKLYSVGNYYTYNWNMLEKYYQNYNKYINYFNNKYDDILNINYEDLINNAEKTLKKVFNYIEEDYNNECLKFYKKKEKVNTASTFTVKEPLYKNIIDRFGNFKSFIL